MSKHAEMQYSLNTFMLNLTFLLMKHQTVKEAPFLVCYMFSAFSFMDYKTRFTTCDITIDTSPAVSVLNLFCPNDTDENPFLRA